MGAKLRCEIFPDDLDATADFYVRVLGFALDRDERSAARPYLAMSLGDVRLGAAARPPVDQTARRPPVGVELVIEVEDIDSCYSRVRNAGWPVTEELQLRSWRLRDFRLLDPSGYYL